MTPANAASETAHWTRRALGQERRGQDEDEQRGDPELRPDQAG